MGKAISGRLMSKILHALCHWVVTKGVDVLQKYLARVCLNTRDSVDFIIVMLTEGMMDSAHSLLAQQGIDMNAKLQDSLEARSRQILGSIEQHVEKYGLDKGRASTFNAAWRRLQSAKIALSKKAKQAQRDSSHCLPEQVSCSSINPDFQDWTL